MDFQALYNRKDYLERMVLQISQDAIQAVENKNGVWIYL